MMKVSEIINKKLIKLNLESTNKNDVISELAELIDNEGRLDSFENYCANVREREDMSTTGIGFGIAIPHGKCMAVKEATVAFGRKEEGIDWQSLDGEPAKIIFLIAVPNETESNLHLKILAALSRKLMDEEFREELIKTQNEDQVLKILTDIFESVEK
ncbi:PTS sugar transporter subunit IIA [Alkalibacter saccharofermentans]|uniref:PTS system IIA component, Fru family (TC 4.A.2) n=1 Tax=Alkalibacter saccharofermentans DSM 14828 TaxID=1120975 RepID=A0A1M4SNX7_9FIRM|nr:fructose PTS transporter subunit IIA [Alkalibacter saccharofermentans]SHE33888.1 PTS system IIA component, Fru family (TC 4.A.2) [Alkalibacter saccharofermentans DSM 14828]